MDLAPGNQIPGPKEMPTCFPYALRLLTALVLPLLLLAVGCGSESDKSHSAATAEVDPCALFTVAETEAVLG